MRKKILSLIEYKWALVIQRKYREYFMRKNITMNNSCDLFSIFVRILPRFVSFFTYLLQRNMRKKKQEGVKILL